MNKEYPIEWVKLACEYLLGRKIGHTTWCNWKKLASCIPYSKSVGFEEGIKLLLIARLRQRSQKVTPLAIQLELINLKSEGKEEKLLTDSLYSGVYTNVTGRDLPKIIFWVTGRKICLRTVRRWAEKRRITFSVRSQLSAAEVQGWIDYVPLVTAAR